MTFSAEDVRKILDLCRIHCANHNNQEIIAMLEQHETVTKEDIRLAINAYCEEEQDPDSCVEPMRAALESFASRHARQVPDELESYDAGLLNDFGGGNVAWWQDYIRNELGRAHDFYQSQIAIPPAPSKKVE